MPDLKLCLQASPQSLCASFHSDVFCGYLLCTNIGRAPRIGIMKGEITPTTFNHQGKLVDCRYAHVSCRCEKRIRTPLVFFNFLLI